MKKVLILAAHPDDEILGCGGFISKYRSKGVHIKVVFIAEGSSCRYSNIKSVEVEFAIRNRNLCAINALKLLKVDDVEFYNLPCGRLDQVPLIEINKIIEKVINEYRPDTVFTHSQHDVNNDHRIIFSSTIVSTRPIGPHIVDRVFSYEVASSSEWSYTQSFQPNIYEGLSENELMEKCNALSIYESEIKSYPFPRSPEGIKALAMVRGMQSGLQAAEAFFLVRNFIR